MIVLLTCIGAPLRPERATSLKPARLPAFIGLSLPLLRQITACTSVELRISFLQHINVEVVLKQYRLDTGVLIKRPQFADTMVWPFAPLRRCRPGAPPRIWADIGWGDVAVRRLREWRTSALLSVRELARAAGITPKTLTDIEYGRRRPTYGTMRHISEALGVDPTEITEFAAAIAARGADPEPPQDTEP